MSDNQSGSEPTYKTGTADVPYEPMAPTSASEPAYPLLRSTNGFNGLTKRELLAGMAMQGLLANPRDSAWNFDPERVARSAVEHADALLAELAK